MKVFNEVNQFDRFVHIICLDENLAELYSLTTYCKQQFTECPQP